MSRNTSPVDAYDDDVLTEDAEQQTPEEIIQNESDILLGLLEAGKQKDGEESYRKIEIKRGGRLLFAFRIRPITEEESQSCWKRATKYSQAKGYGQPKKALETNNAKFRSYQIYTATIDEDRVKTWDNRKAWDEFGIITGVDMIDKVLLPGEKDRILDILDDICGFNDELDNIAKN